MNFRKTNITIFSVLLIFIITDILLHVSFYLYILLLFSYVFIIIYASFNICSNFYLKAICKAKINTNKIAITFDDGPCPETTLYILDVLEKYNAKATFFCIGCKAEVYPDIIKKINSKGHTIGNHTKLHNINFTFSSTKKVQKEIYETNKIIENIIEKSIVLFRPPFGITNPNIAKAVCKLNMKTIGWNIRSLDTVKNKKITIKRIKKTKSGDIILFHDTVYDTIKILDNFLNNYKNKNIKFVTINDL